MSQIVSEWLCLAAHLETSVGRKGASSLIAGIFHSFFLVVVNILFFPIFFALVVPVVLYVCCLHPSLSVSFSRPPLFLSLSISLLHFFSFSFSLSIYLSPSFSLILSLYLYLFLFLYLHLSLSLFLSLSLSLFLISSSPSLVKEELNPEVVIIEHLATMIKQKFDSTVADAIIPQLLDTPEWLKSMMADITFRKMLIELYDQNRNSTLIKVALKQICTMGHHRFV